MSSLIQRSFGKGEISPTLHSRVDSVAYATGLKTCRNYVVRDDAGLDNRPGTILVGEVSDSTRTVRAIPFVFNNDQSYMLQFGHKYLRFVRNGVQLTKVSGIFTSDDIINVTQANPCRVTWNGSIPVSNGDEISITGVAGMTELNGRSFKVFGVSGQEFNIKYMDGSNVDSTAFGAFVAGPPYGQIKIVYEIVTLYEESDLQDIRYTQSADVMTLVHPNHPVQVLSRFGDVNWTIADKSFLPSQAGPITPAPAFAPGPSLIEYKITAVNALTLEESLPGEEGTFITIVSISKSNPAVVTTISAHGSLTGSEIRLVNVTGMKEVNGRTFSVVATGATTFQLKDEDSTNYGTYTGGGFTARPVLSIPAASLPTPASPLGLFWGQPAGAGSYRIYKRANSGIFGLIGVTSLNTFLDIGLTPDITNSVPTYINPFYSAGKFPSAIASYQQRMLLGNTRNNPETVWASRIGLPNNFGFDNPTGDADGFNFPVRGRQVNEVEHLLDLNALLVLTSQGEWSASSGQSAAFTPASINLRQNTYNGSGSLQPLVVDSNALYCQARGTIIRDLGFDVESDGYRGNNLSLFSSHLFKGFTLRDWAYQRQPGSVVWIVRSDGTLLGLTYIREHQIIGWHRHDTDGVVEQVCCVPEGTEDALYLVVKRTIGGVAKRYIERMASRTVSDIDDAVFSDSALQYDGTNTSAITMNASSVDFTHAGSITLTASAAYFSADSVGNEIVLYGEDTVRLTIETYVNPTVAVVRADKTVPVSMRFVDILTWALAVDQFGGLWHLEGKRVSILADSFVLASPNNPQYPTSPTVTNGTVTIAAPRVKATIGLPFVSDMEALDIDSAGGETMSDKQKIVQRVALRLHESRGVFVGGEAPPDDSIDPNILTELKVDERATYDSIELLSGVFKQNIRAEWNSNGRIFVRNTEPVPVTILAIVPAGIVSTRG